VCVCVCVCASVCDYSPVCEFTASSTCSVVKCLTYSPADDSVYVVLNTGRLVVCNATVSSSRSPVRTECHGNGKPVHCIAVRTLQQARCMPPFT